MMKSINILIVIGLVFLLNSCQSTKVYFHDTNDYDDGEIWGGQLSLFFKKNEDIKISQINNKKLSSELNRIRNVLISNNEFIEIDDGFYEYAFVLNKKDTLFTNGAFKEWRYRNLKSTVDNSINLYLINK